MTRSSNPQPPTPPLQQKEQTEIKNNPLNFTPAFVCFLRLHKEGKIIKKKIEKNCVNTENTIIVQHLPRSGCQ
jgi:hypothetical protein